MTSYTHNIAETRDILHKISNELVDSYLQNLQEKTEKDVQENQNILMLTEQNKLQFQEIVEKDKEIVDYKKKCYDYEQIINDYQSKMVQIDEEQKCEDKVSIVKVQADELSKKDIYIEQLQNKIKFLQSSKKNVSFKIEEVEEIIDPEIIGWSPTTSKTPKEKKEEILVEDKYFNVHMNEEEEEEEVIQEKENQMDIDNKEDEEDDEDDELDEVEIEYKRIKYKGKKYYIIIGEEPQIVYNILEDEDVGLRVGIRKKKEKGTGYNIDFD